MVCQHFFLNKHNNSKESSKDQHRSHKRTEDTLHERLVKVVLCVVECHFPAAIFGDVHRTHLVIELSSFHNNPLCIPTVVEFSFAIPLESTAIAVDLDTILSDSLGDCLFTNESIVNRNHVLRHTV